MGILERFFGKKARSAGTSPGNSALVANGAIERPLSLQVLFPGKLSLDVPSLGEGLRSYDRTMSKAQCDFGSHATLQGAAIGLLGWGKHVIRLVGFDAPMPAEALEPCLQGAPYEGELKARARAHQSHVLLYYAGYEGSPIEQYVALAATAGVLAEQGAIVAVNEAARTSAPIELLKRSEGDMVGLLRSFPIPILYGGFAKFTVEGTSGVWMRTFGNHLLGLPDLALLSAGHHDGQNVLELFSDVLAYLHSSGAAMEPGHTMETGEDSVLRARAPEVDEYFLESEGTLLVLERISRAEIAVQ